MKTMPKIISVLCVVLAAVSCSQRESVYKKSLPLMDTIVTITVVSDGKDAAEKAIDAAFAEIGRFGDLINFYSEKSELSEINRNAGLQKTVVSPHTLAVVEKAVHAAEKSEGAFDPTMGPVVRLWDFLNKDKPSDEAIKQALSLVDYRNVVIDRDNSTVLLRRSGMLLDLGGIAKGYAADLAVRSLMNNNIRSGIVAIAGDIKTFGMKPDNTPWIVGIRNPRQTGEKDGVIATLRLSGQAISTSGDYERFFIKDGSRYHHLLDPKTGYPAMACRSVSVVADKTVDTDAFSTAVFIIGPDKGMALAKELGMEAMIIDTNGNRFLSDGLKEKISFEKSD